MSDAAPHGSLPPSPWVRRWTSLVPAGSRVLDVACGSGRHVRWFAEHGCRVTGVDRDAESLRTLTMAETLAADLENGPWPLPGRRFDAVVVTHYLWRPLWPRLIESLDDGAVLIYETFCRGQEAVGRPSNPAFLLEPGELLRLATGLRVVAYEDGFLDAPARFVQRIAAVRETGGSTEPRRYLL
jgi:SAM-dependent methyltransferase